MQQRKIACIVLMLCATTLKVYAQHSYQSRAAKYIDQYKDWAIAEQKRSGVPAAITLAQGIHETNAGGSELATNANNHFGIKCRKEWKGQTYAYTDDAPNECFRKYPSAIQSYKDHSDYLTGSKRYDNLFQLSAKDYKGWAHGLKRCGYATNPRYAHLIIKLVEEYNLQQYTFAALQDDYNPVKEAENDRFVTIAGEVIPEQDAKPITTTTTKTSGRKSGMSVSYGVVEQPVKKKIDEENIVSDPLSAEYGKLVKVNGVKAFYAKKGTVLLDDAFKYNIRYAKLLEINELPDLPLEADMYIFIEKKNTKGIHQTHIVKQGETLIQIAQIEAMQLKYLKYYNRISVNEEPMAGAVLQLQQYSENKPATYVKNVAPRNEAVAFAGSNPNVIPQGATRKRASYLSKKEIKAAQQENVAETITQEEHADEIAENKTKAIETIADTVVADQTVATEQKIEEPKVVNEAPVVEKIDTPQPIATTTNTIASKTEEPKALVIDASEKVVSSPQETITPTIIEPKVEEQKQVIKEEATATPVIKADDKKIDVVTKSVLVNQTTVETPNTVVAANPPAVNMESVTEENTPLSVTKTKEKTKTKKEEVEYDVVQPAPVIVGAKKNEVVASKVATMNAITPVKTEIKPVATEKVVVTAPEKIEVPQIPEEPKDEFERLKQKLDKVVYAGEPTPIKRVKQEPKKTETVIRKEEAKKETNVVAATADMSKIYTVKKGDTAFSIAKKYNITMRQLMDWNKLDFDKVKEGQKLRVKP